MADAKTEKQKVQAITEKSISEIEEIIKKEPVMA